MKYFKMIWKEAAWQLKEQWRGRTALMLFFLTITLVIFLGKNYFALADGGSWAYPTSFWYWWTLFYMGTEMVGYHYSSSYRLLPFTERELKKLLIGSLFIRSVLFCLFMAAGLLPLILAKRQYLLFCFVFGVGFLAVPAILSTSEQGFFSYQDKLGKKRSFISYFHRFILLVSFGILVSLYEDPEICLWQRVLVMVVIYIIGGISFFVICRKIKKCPVEFFIT